MRRTVIGFGVLILVGSGLLTGCSAAAKDPVGLTASSTTTTQSPTPTSTTSPSPGPGVVQDLSDPELGVIFEPAPELNGDAADVYNWIATFEKESWRTTTLNAVNPSFDVIASAEVKAQMQAAVDANLQDGSTFGGILRVRVGAVSVEGDAARGTACEDYGEVTFSDADGPDTPEEAGFGTPILMELTLARVSAENRWRIVTLKENGTC